MLLERPARHVIFDLDGVLLDTEPLYTQATQDIVGRYGKVFDWSLKANMIGRDSREGANYLVRELELPISAAEYLQRRSPLLESLFASVVAISGAESFVRSLHRSRVRMGVATSAIRRLTRIKLQRHAWFELFDELVCGDDVEQLKPAPDIFLLAAEKLRVEPSCCVVIEDSPAGVEAALGAGMQVVALPDPEMAADRYPGASAVIRSYEELSLESLGLEPG